MPKATFYTHVSNPSAFAARLATRAIRDGGRVLVWSDSAEQIARLDKDLWQLDAESFIPHEVWYEPDAMPSETAVILSCGNDLPRIPADMVVLNLSPDFWNAAPQTPARVLEIVGESLEELAEARERFRAYKQSGFSIEHHEMKGKA